MNVHEGFSRAYVANKQTDIGVFLEWSDNLPLATHCRLENPGDYFLAIEPCNTLCAGRDEIERRDMLPILKAGEEQTFRLRFSVLEGQQMNRKIGEWRAEK